MGEKLERYSIEFDDFVGTVIGSYTTLEGKEGVVMQQDGTRVVHVYGRKHLKPAQPLDSDCARDGETDCGATRCRDLGCFGACKPSDRTADVTVELCSDCPPVGYETDKTRCATCPRRDAFTVGRR